MFYSFMILASLLVSLKDESLDGITDVMDMNLGKLGDGEGQVVLQSMES